MSCHIHLTLFSRPYCPSLLHTIYWRHYCDRTGLNLTPRYYVDHEYRTLCLVALHASSDMQMSCSLNQSLSLSANSLSVFFLFLTWLLPLFPAPLPSASLCILLSICFRISSLRLFLQLCIKVSSNGSYMLLNADFSNVIIYLTVLSILLLRICCFLVLGLGIMMLLDQDSGFSGKGLES